MVCKPRWARILAITAGSLMAAMSVKGPPHSEAALDGMMTIHPPEILPPVIHRAITAFPMEFDTHSPR